MRTVLIADSDAFQRQLIDMLLAVDNHRVVGFESGRSLLEYLQSHVPDLVILDYSLPDINGADLCAKMKKVKRLAHVPVLLVTAAHKLELVKGIATAVRADRVLAKPLGDKKLREHILELLQRSDQPRAVETVMPETKITSTALQIDPILEQALANLGHESRLGSGSPGSSSLNSSDLPYHLQKLATDTPSLNLTPVPLDRDEPAPYTLELPGLELPSQTLLSETQPNLRSLETLPPLFHETPLAEPAHKIPLYEVPLHEVPLHGVHSDSFQQHANAALESLLGQGSLLEQGSILEQGATTDTSSGVFEIFDDDTHGHGISEQELLDSLQAPLGTNTSFNAPRPVLNPPPFLPEAETYQRQEPANYSELDSDPEAAHLEPQAYTLGGTPSPSNPAFSNPALAASFEETVSDIEAELTTYRAQIQQLSAENERLRATLLELETGAPLVTSKSYLDMIEELEMLRRLSDIQVKQMDSLQRQNQKLMEDAQQAQERRRGLFGFLQPKNLS